MKRVAILLLALVGLCNTLSAQLTEQQQIQKLNYAYQHIRNNYVDDVSLEPLVEEAIIASLRELDPHSRYLSREEMAKLKERIRGEFAGIGIKYTLHRDTLVVRSIIDNSPAMRGDIRPNDRITTIDDKCIVGIKREEIAAMLQGNKGSEVKLGIVRRGENNLLSITLRRDNIESSAISAAFTIDNIGYIAISKFSKPLTSEFYAAYKSLGDIESLIIDLRDNAGGAITAAIDLSSLFLNKGDVIVSTEGRTSSQTHIKRQESKPIGLPLVVMINENSASASEIFAGAMQDHDRGIIVGHTSYGKGLVQKVIDLKDGSGITLTVARYKTPSGRLIQRPYTMGDSKAYYADSLRYMHPDSLHNDLRPQFKTLKRGRVVYGGGGITPDIYINTDNVKLSKSIIEARNEGIFEHTIIDYWDMASPEQIKAQYPTVEAFFAGYTLDSELCATVVGILGDIAISATERDYIETMLLATIAEQTYGNNARQYVYGRRFDIMMLQAIEIAKNGNILTDSVM